ncbi:MAG: monovalent cation/H+ antiporter subunit D family protein [Calditrichaeota bacterium]|nr:monovalent cation/H+ antiporter subunit D family protein [Calditrichota bacterium]MBT7616075.1 monovalent cation/H+ antiporter subunit D family protein [Calditrichota bacterium]MBT7788224.1 monovalent cation/H+ antiporter subunit D family protein [Calditrichota bacterium]
MSNLQAPILLVTIPLLAAFFAALGGMLHRKISFPIALIAIILSFHQSIIVLLKVVNDGVINYRIGGWMPPFGIEYVVDHLNAMVLVVITFVSLISIIYSKLIVERELPDKIPQFYTLYLLLTTGLLGITITGDAFNLYVLLEISALATYALLALGKDRALISTFNYLILGTIGASLYLLGVGHLYIATGSLNMADLFRILPSLSGNSAVMVGFILIIVGVWIKMAFFPAHGWLPNAYTYAPSSSICLIAPLMTKVSVYIMIRIMFSVFSAEFTFANIAWQTAVVWCSVIAIIGGSLQALAQRDFRKMLTFLVVAEVGYMVGGVWLANEIGISGAILHILNDALMTLCLFLVAGILIFKTQRHQLMDFRGMFRKMPVTMGAFIIGALSMIGVPPTCGFFSKWYLIQGAIEAGRWEFMAALIFSSLVNAVLFFRIIEIGHFQHETDSHDHAEEKISEAPAIMLIPLVVVAIALVVIGLYTNDIVTNVIQHAVPVL